MQLQLTKFIIIKMLPRQLVISLKKLLLPPKSNLSSIIMAVQVQGHDYFNDQEKKVKQNQVNFWLEKVFIPTTPHGITFKIYSVQAGKRHKQLASIFIDRDELKSVEKRSALFHSYGEGCELIWEAAIFEQFESSYNYETDRDYTQFSSINVGNDISDIESQLSAFSKSYHKETEDTELDESSQIWTDPLQWRPHEQVSAIICQPQKKKISIKSHLYESMIHNISKMFQNMSILY